MTPEERDARYAELHPLPGLGDAGWLCQALEQEIDDRRNGAGRDLDRLLHCAFLLSRLGRLSDVTLLWRAKTADADAYDCLDAQVLVGAGVDATLHHLDTTGEAGAPEAAAYLRACRESGELDDLEGWATWRAAYLAPPPSEPS
jgi:hypothetical protein